MRRSASSPALSASKAAPSTVAVNEAISHSSGCASFDSPTSVAKLIEIRRKLFCTTLFFIPIVVVEFWKGHIYAAVWWSPQNAPPAILQPTRWHTTLLRCWSDADLGDRLATWTTSLQSVLDCLLFSGRLPDNSVAVWLRFAPWLNSYNFGVPLEVAFCLDPLRALLTSYIKTHDPNATITPDADAHISWH